MSKINIDKTKRIIIWVLFALYWTTFIIRIIFDSSIESGSIVRYIITNVIIFLPLTIVIALDKAVCAVLTLILYEIVYIFLSVIQIVIWISSISKGTLVINTGSIVMLLSGVFLFILSIFLFWRLIRILQNRPHEKWLSIVIVFLIYIIIIGTSFILDINNPEMQDLKVSITDFINNISITALTSLYIAFFPQRALIIFK